MPSPIVIAARLLAALFVACLHAGAATGAGLTLHPERHAETDLAITGQISGLSAGATRYLRWRDLAQLPTSRLQLDGEFTAGVQDVTVLYLQDLLDQLPLTPEADLLIATCRDGYASVYPKAFVHDYRPFLILKINGRPPEQWLETGLSFNPGPYVISISSQVVPAVAQLMDAGHKRPWGVTTLEVATERGRFAAFYQGRWADLPAVPATGRKIWLNSCTSCHQGPADSFGGTKGNRPFALLAVHAAHNNAFFRTYVRNPKSLVPSATMEPHPHYTDAELAALSAFLALGAPALPP